MKSELSQQISLRVKQATDVCFSGWGIKRKFCIKYNIDYGNFSRALREYQNHTLDPAWIAALVLEFDLSADWILTGRGEIGHVKNMQIENR